MLSDITLTSEQFHAVKLIKKWFTTLNRKIPFILAGLAGTGKTTIIRHITNDLEIKEHQIRYCAFTGKAALVMKQKGMFATTIHSLIYEPRTDPMGKVVFRLKMSLGLDVKLIICDESSMIGKEIQGHLESYGIPILYVGDHGQLPPVSTDTTNLMLNPNFRLETIHRQALDNPIIWVANQARIGKFIKYGKYGTAVFKATPNQIGIETLKTANQIICGKNNSRKNINNQMRSYYGFTSIFPEMKDKLICLKNNSQNGLVNGMTGLCSYYDEQKHKMDFISDEDDRYSDLNVDHNIFVGTKNDKYRKMIDQFDFGYCITCHKSQGSQYDNVIVYEERLGYDNELHNRWLYTSITRAAERLIIIS
jgi:exodeoxyribonuclease V